MRRPTILVFCSALTPAAAFVSGCLDTSSSGPPGDDGGFTFDSAFPAFDAATADGAVGVPETGATDTGAPDAALPSTDLTSTPVSFGPIDCGTVPPPRALTFTNTGAAPLTYSVSLVSGAYFALQGSTSGTVDPGASATLTLVPPAVPVTSTAGTALTDTLHVTTNIPGLTSIDVPVSVTPRGGSLTVSPAPASFGQVFVTDRAPDAPVAITNVGNAPVTVSVGAPANGDFAFVYTGSPLGVSLAPGAALPGAAARFKPTVTGLQSTSAAITTTGVMCASASAVAMSGTGTYALVSVTPDTLPFGTTPCGAPPATAQQVTVHNGYDFAIPYSSSLKGGASSPYTLTGASGSVAASGTAVITVTPRAIAAPASVAPGAFDDALTVTPVAPGAAAASVALTQSASGAILAVAMPSAAFSNVNANQTASLPFSVLNTGNVDAPLTVGATGSGFGAAFTTAATATANGGKASGNATFSPPALGPASGTMTVTTTAPQCGPAPGAIPLSASGIGPVAGVPTATVIFAVTCGGGASPSQSVTISNATGTAPLVLSNLQSASGLVTILSAPGPIPAGGSGTITIAAKAAVIGTARGGQSYADTLSFTTNELGTPTRTIPLSIAVNGANLQFVDGSGAPFSGVLNFTTCSPRFAFGVKNTGDLAATVTAAPASGASSYMQNQTFVNGVSIAAGATATDTAAGRSNDSAAPCIGTDTYVFTEAAADAVCQDLPLVSGQQALEVVYNYDASSCHMGQCC